MTINVEYVGECQIESRKMRTTRGPGFTNLKQVYHVTDDNPENLVHRLNITSALNDEDLRPPSIGGFGAQKVEFTTYSPAFSSELYVTLTVRYIDVGHAKRAELGKSVLRELRKREKDLGFIKSVVMSEIGRLVSADAAEKATQEMRWMASGIVQEARRLGREDVNYAVRVALVRAEADKRAEEIALDAASKIAREHGVDEAELRASIVELLGKPVYTLSEM